MARDRTWMIKMPSDGVTPIDIIPSLPGSQSAPVAGSAVPQPKTAPPPGWNGQPDGAYFEWFARSLMVDNQTGNLGFRFKATALDVGPVPVVALSSIITFLNSPNVAGRVFFVEGNIYAQVDEDAAQKGP